MFIAVLVIAIVLLAIVAGSSNLKPSSRPAFGPNPNANEPDVFASPDADLDPESDTGEPDGWN